MRAAEPYGRLVVIDDLEHLTPLRPFLLEVLLPGLGDGLRCIVAGTQPLLVPGRDAHWEPFVHRIDVGPTSAVGEQHLALRVLGRCCVVTPTVVRYASTARCAGSSACWPRPAAA